MESSTNDLEAITKGRWQRKSNSDPWSKTEEPKWEPYSLEHNYLIEKRYHDQQKEIDLGDYLVYPFDMLQKKKGNPKAQRPIRRVNWIDDEETIDRSERYSETELPKTINKIFGSLGDFLTFFSRRNSEILDFTNQFKEFEKSNNLNILNQKIIPKLVCCFEEVLLKPNLEKLKDASLSSLKRKVISKIKEQTEKLILFFKEKFLDIEEFYRNIFKAYTMDTDLYQDLNKYLRNESWVEVDKLLPYMFCLCKAFFYLRLTNSLALNDIIKELKTPSSITLYRGTAFDEFALSFYDLKTLQHFSWNSLTSTSTNKKMAEEFMYRSADIPNKKYPVMFEIELPLTTEFESEYLKWIDIQQYSAIPTEDEVILPPGSAFDLIKCSTGKNKVTIIKIRLKNEIKSLAKSGMMMQGALQNQMMTEKEARVVGLEGGELYQALMSFCGNSLIEEVEFCLCTFDNMLLQKMFELLPALEKVRALKFISCKYEGIKGVAIEKFQCGGLKKIQIIESYDFFQIICNKRQNQEYWMFLRELDLDFRSRRNLTDGEFYCAVSQGLRNFPQLTHLKINFEGGRQITDRGFSVLAQEFNFLTKLTDLDLNLTRCEQLTDETMSILAKGISHLIQLSSLALNFSHCKKIVGHGVDNLAKGISFLTQLSYLSLNLEEWEQLTDEEFDILTKEISSLTQLTSLDLRFDNSKITDKGIILLASQRLDHLKKLTSLTLRFRYCSQITEKGVNSLGSEGLKYLSQLRSLNLEFSDCHKTVPKSVFSLFSPGLAHLNQLTSLAIYFGRNTNPDVKSLALQGLRYLTQLTSLTLDLVESYQLGDEELDILVFYGLKCLTQLTSLNLSLCSRNPNAITDKGLKNLATQGLKSLTSLTSLKLHFCYVHNLTKKVFASLACQGIRHLIQLRSLEIIFEQCNGITRKGINHLMSQGLKKLPKLTSLILDFSFCPPSYISREILHVLAFQWQHIIPSAFLIAVYPRLQTISFADLQAQDVEKPEELRFVRESSSQYQQSLSEEFSVLTSDLSKSSPQHEQTLTQTLFDILNSMSTKSKEQTHYPLSIQNSLQFCSKICHLTSLTLDFNR